MADSTIKNILHGGEFLIKESNASQTFIPEQFNEEQLMMAQAAADFIDHDVLPHMNEIDAQQPGLTVKLMEAAGDLGLLGAGLPEEYGGFGKDYITTTLLLEKIGGGGSFAVSMAAHTGIGTLPILYFGTDEQKKKYLPGLASGKIKAAYCLTEPGSGSDALAAKTTAMRTDDGKHFIINGQKMWITNGGFADVFIVFAKIGGDNLPPGKGGFSGIIVDANTPGVVRGEEEKKMGIKGSSTRQIFFQDAKVPVENLLGVEGKGHLIAFNILNIGRHKLGAAALGGMKKVCNMAVAYATQREQFKTKIGNFGAIKHKLGEMAIKTFATETALYRAANDIENKKQELIAAGKPYHEALMGAAEEYAVECSLIKVFASEALDYVVDENVQIHGGIGFSEEYAAARAYRDSRINRIFEGTNEINRLLSIDMLLKRALKGQLDLMTPALAVQKELMAIPDFSREDDTIFSKERKAIAAMKKTLLMTAGAAVQKLMMQLEHEQELIMNLSDMLMEIYICESMLLRCEKMNEMNAGNELNVLMMQCYLNDAIRRCAMHAQDAIATFAEGDEKRMMLMGVKRFCKWEPMDTKTIRRKIAEEMMK